MADGDPAEAADIVFPESFERIAKDFLFTVRRGIGRIDDQCGLCPEKANGNAFPGITLKESVCNPRVENAIDEACEDRRRHPPPVRVDEDDPVRCGDFRTVPGDVVRQGGIAGDLVMGQYRIESLLIELMEAYLMAVLPEGARDRFCDRMVETPRMRVGEDNRDLHAFPRVHFREVALKNV